jgi:hypothetical protein
MDWLFWVPKAIQDHPEKFLEGMTLFAVIGGFLGALKFLIEYSRDNRRKRMELYIKLREEFRTKPSFGKIMEFLETYAASEEADKPALGETFLREVDRDTRLEFAAFLDDLAMIMKSGALRARVANYMFGYYAILCWKNDPFWTGLDRDGPYWALLKYFIGWMKLHQWLLERAPWLVALSLRI